MKIRNYTRNSPGDEIANVNFLYHYIVHALQNTIDSCVNAATDRHGYVLERRITKFSEITQCYGHYAVQGHSRSPIFVPTESSYTTSYWWLILTSRPSSQLCWVLVKFSLSRGACLTLTLSLGVIPCQYRHKWYIHKTRLFVVHFCCGKYWCIFNHFYVIRPESYQIR